MKRVAIIGADFAPSSLPPATRIRFFARHLPEFGWEPTVITTDPKYYDWQFDIENEQLIPRSLNVIRTRAWKSSWTRKVGIGDVGMRSLRPHWLALKQLCKQRSIDLVFIPVPPSVPMVLGRLAHLRFGIPYVVDYIDPWVSEYYWSVPKSERPPKWPLAYAMARVLEPFALKHVGHITGVSAGTTASVVSRYSQLSDSDATEIPYGAEPTDFAYLRTHPRENSIFDKNDSLFHMSYVGACIPGMHPTVRALFQALRAGLDREPEVFGRLRLHFIGTSYAPGLAKTRRIADIARELKVEEYVDERPARVPYLESLQIMLDSDALFLVGSDEAHYTASKVFPYLLARRRVLAIFHEESSIVDILKENAACATVSYSHRSPPALHVPQIESELRRLLTTSQTCEEADPETSGFLSARAMTARLANAFELALTRHQSHPASVLSEGLTK